MTITVLPDPARPMGGYARLTLAAAALPQDSVTVAVLSNYTRKHLGADGFQTEPCVFGPYAVARDATQAWVTVGPEIVNQIEEYATLRLTVGTVSADVSWPDSVVPAFGAATIGAVMAPGAAAATPPPALLGQGPQASEPTVAPPPDPTPPDPAAVAPDAAPRTRPAWHLPALGGVGLLAAGALAVFLLPRGQAPVPVPVPPDAPCSAAALGALAPDAWTAALGACAGDISVDDALGVIETRAAAEDTEALLLFGKLYDAAVRDGAVETAIGLSFDDSPAQAVDYYARAAEAGSVEAAGLLGAACARLAEASDTRSVSVHADHCAR